MDNLRLILILIGLVVLALIWLLYKPDGSERGAGARRRSDAADGPARREPKFGDAPSAGGSEATPPGTSPATADAPAADQDQYSDEPVQPGFSALDPVFEPESEDDVPTGSPASAGHSNLPDESQWREPEQVAEQAAVEAVAAGSGAPRIVTLYVRVRGSRRISGLSLLDAAIKAGLRFGEMKIFHRRHRGATRPVFSMANITRPGSFDPAGWNLFETPGVTLFMTLPGPVSALDAWDAMLATGRRLSELLDAELLDDSKSLLTRQKVARIRESMREFDRQNGLPDSG